MNQLTPYAASAAPPTLVAAIGKRASLRFLEFFAATIRNPHTRRAYARAVSGFLAWCEDYGVPSIAAVPLLVATWIGMQTRERAAPSVKQQLATILHLFDWMVTGQVVPTNPAASVRGPSHVVRQGKTPVLEPQEARALLDGIDVTTHAGLRDRALIALMVHSFARIGGGAGDAGGGRVHAEPPLVGSPARERRQGARYALPPQPGELPHRLSGRHRHGRRRQKARCSAPSGVARTG